MRRRVPITLVVGLVLRIVAVLATYARQQDDWDAYDPTSTHLLDKLFQVGAALAMPAILMMAVGAWLERPRAPSPGRRIGITIASASAWLSLTAMLATGQSARLLVQQEWFRDNFDKVLWVEYLALGAFGIALGFAAERNRVIGVIVALASGASAIYAVFFQDSDDHSKLPVAGLCAALALQLVVAIRSRTTREPDASRGVAGLRRLAWGLFAFAAMTVLQIGLFLILSLNEAMTWDLIPYVFLGVYLMHLVPLGWAVAGAVVAADARIGASWRLAIAAPMLALVISEANVESVWMTAAITFAGPLLLASALVHIARRGSTRSALIKAAASIALFLSTMAIFMLALDEREDTLAYVMVVPYAVAQGAAWAFLGMIGLDDARLVEQDPTALDRVFR